MQGAEQQPALDMPASELQTPTHGFQRPVPLTAVQQRPGQPAPMVRVERIQGQGLAAQGRADLASLTLFHVEQPEDAHADAVLVRHHVAGVDDEHLPFLHFELCYYQAIEYCIEHRFERFEGGAQGEHKMARALLPVRATSAHWLAHPRFADAVARFLEREGQGVDAYLEHLQARSPLKKPAPVR